MILMRFCAPNTPWTLVPGSGSQLPRDVPLRGARHAPRHLESRAACKSRLLGPCSLD
jgi:hypothetical protein